MDAFKADHFKRYYGFSLPSIRALSPLECIGIVQRLATHLRLPQTTDGLRLVRALDEKQEVLHGHRADTEGFDLLDVLPPRAYSDAPVLVNWHRFDEIDEIETVVLVTFFTDVWYPAADDIDILNADVSWVVSVRHDGLIKRVDFGAEDPRTAG